MEAGVSHFDTGAFYCGGEAEARLGRILRARPDLKPFISTKTGTHYDEGRVVRKDFSEAAIRADVEQSLSRLGVDRLDLLYLHGPADKHLASALETLDALKSEGKIAASGICGEGKGLRAALDAGVDVLMGAYNVLNRRHETIFAHARAQGLSTVAIAPLAQGLYARGFFLPTSIADGWKLARALVRNRPELKRARAARAVLESAPPLSAAQAALGFTLANPNIDVAVTTTTSLTHLAQSVEAARNPLDQTLITALAALDDPPSGA